MARSSAPARQAILAAAEQLFAEQGVEGPTLREIGAAAGQRNNSAVQYHFGDRDGLLAAVLEPHVADLDEQRRCMLAAAELDGPPSVETLVDLLILPLAAKLEQPSGVRYLQIQAALLGRDAAAPRREVQPWSRPVMDDLIDRVSRTLAPLDRDEGAARHLLVTTMVFNGLANRSAMTDGPPVDVLVRTLSESVRAVLTMPSIERVAR
jgi:AcrR family transcriptional regulator